MKEFTDQSTATPGGMVMECTCSAKDMTFGQCCKVSLFAEIERLQASRNAEGDRLDWLLCKLPGNVLRDLVGELSDTGDVAKWRAAIDRAAGFPPPNDQHNRPASAGPG